MNIKTVLLQFEYSHGNVCANSIINHPLFNSSSTHQSEATSDHSHPVLLSGILVAPDFVVNWIEVRAVRWPQIWKFVWVIMTS